MKKRILVTGGAGFIGYHLMSRLVQEVDSEIVCIDNLSRGRMDRDLVRLLENRQITFVQGDLTAQETYRQFVETFDEVYHLAGVLGVQRVVERPDEVVRINALSTLQLLEWFCGGGGKRIVFASTSEVYAWTQKFYPLPIPTSEDVPLSLTDLSNPRSSYAGSKIFCELAVTQYAGRFGKRFSIVRYHNVYGPRMGFNHVIPELTKRIIDGEDPLKVYSSDHIRAFCYISDAVEATILCMRHESADGRVFNVGNSGQEVTIADLARILIRLSGHDRGIKHYENAHDPIRRRCPDVSLAKKLLGYKSQISLEEGVAKTWRWYFDYFVNKPQVVA